MTDETVSNQRPVPDPKKCRTMYLGQTLAFSSCLAENPNGCEYALRFASCVFCCHPERRRFEKTPALLSLDETILHIGFCNNSSTPINDTVSHQQPVPHREKCRTMYLGPSLDLSKCLVKNRNGCEFAVRFGAGVYCHHHDRRRVERIGLS
jgi:hypothetical protein